MGYEFNFKIETCVLEGEDHKWVPAVKKIINTPWLWSSSWLEGEEVGELFKLTGIFFTGPVINSLCSKVGGMRYRQDSQFIYRQNEEINLEEED